VRPETIQAMQITRVHDVGVAVAVVERECNATVCTSKILLATGSADFRSGFGGANPDKTIN
jgi:hypothetical protein